MTFRADELATFSALFDASRVKIRAFPGCRHLELLRDPDNSTVRMTLSHWDSAAALDAYRQSDLFRHTWAATKVLFADKPLAFSMEPLPIGT